MLLKRSPPQQMFATIERSNKACNPYVHEINSLSGFTSKKDCCKSQHRKKYHNKYAQKTLAKIMQSSGVNIATRPEAAASSPYANEVKQSPGHIPMLGWE